MKVVHCRFSGCTLSYCARRWVRVGGREPEPLKEVFVHRLTLLGSVSSPGSSHKADVDSPQRRLSPCGSCSVCLSGFSCPRSAQGAK